MAPDLMEKQYREDLRSEAEAVISVGSYGEAAWARRFLVYLDKLEECERYSENLENGTVIQTQESLIEQLQGANQSYVKLMAEVRRERDDLQRQVNGCQHERETWHSVVSRNLELHEGSEALAARERRWLEIGQLLVRGRALTAKRRAETFLREAYEVVPDE